MKLCFVCHEFPPLGGGAATALDYFTRTLATLGHDVQVITIGLPGSESYETDDYGREMVKLHAGRRKELAPGLDELLLSYAALRFRSKKWIDRFSPDVVIAYFAFPAAHAVRRIVQRKGIPFVVSLRGSDVPGHLTGRWGSVSQIMRFLIKPIWREADIMVANGEHLTELASRFAKPKRLFNLPNGVDTNIFYPLNDEPLQCFKPLRILCVGQLIKHKRSLEVVKIVHRLVRDGLDVCLTLVGDGPLASPIRDFVNKEQLDDVVTVTGHVSRDAMPETYRAHDILLHLSVAEGISNVIMEALASGLVIIAPPSAVDNTIPRNAFISIDEIDVEVVKSHISMILKNPAHAIQLRRNALAAAKSLDWGESADKFCRILQGSLGLK